MPAWAHTYTIHASIAALTQWSCQGYQIRQNVSKLKGAADDEHDTASGGVVDQGERGPVRESLESVHEDMVRRHAGVLDQCLQVRQPVALVPLELVRTCDGHHPPAIDCHR